MNIKRFLFAALCCVVSQAVLAQAKRISGTVTDNEGPVMMANVVEVDANDRIVSATQTDFNGNFSMQVKSPKNKLKFSYVGDKTKVVAIGNQTSFKIVLQPESGSDRQGKAFQQWRSDDVEERGGRVTTDDGHVIGRRSVVHLRRRGPAG